MAEATTVLTADEAEELGQALLDAAELVRRKKYTQGVEVGFYLAGIAAAIPVPEDGTETEGTIFVVV